MKRWASASGVLCQQLNKFREVGRYDTQFSTRREYAVALLQHGYTTFPRHRLDHMLAENILERCIREGISFSRIQIDLVRRRCNIGIQPARRSMATGPKLQLADRMRFEVVTNDSRIPDPTSIRLAYYLPGFAHGEEGDTCDDDQQKPAEIVFLGESLCRAFDHRLKSDACHHLSGQSVNNRHLRIRLQQAPHGN